MPTITFRRAHETRVVDVDAGTSVMRAALAAGVEGIVGECGGQAMCATCRVHVDAAHLTALPPRSEDEEAMLEGVGAELDDPAVRLGCQLTVGELLPDLVVRVPDSQY